MKENERDGPEARRIKKEIYAQPHVVRVEPPPGWEDVTAREMRELSDDWTLPGKFVGTQRQDESGLWFENLDFRQLIEIPLRLLTAADALWALQSRHVGSFGELIAMIEQLPWALYLPPGAKVRLRVNSFRSKLFHEGKIEELIAQSLEKSGYHIASTPGCFRLVCEQIANRHTIFLSLAGEFLYRRHYKEVHQHGAPLQEHLAAACLSWAAALQGPEWQPDLLAIPFAGSGTFYAEELLRRGCVPAFLWRMPDYSVAQLACLPAASWAQIIKRREALAPVPVPPALLIEKDSEIAAGLEQNLAFFRRRLAPDVPSAEMVVADVFKQQLPPGRIWMPLNPPYGLRLDQGGEQAPHFYRELALWLRAQMATEIRGFVLVADSASLYAFQHALPEGAVQGVQSFSQGGQHVRCVAFRLGGSSSRSVGP